MPEDLPARRPLAVRDTRWARAVAAWLAARRVGPNAISAASVVFAALAGAALACWSRCDGWAAALLALAGAAGIQLRLLCNLFDGMVAVEGGMRSPTGDLWNEVPDRAADTLIIVGAGYGAAGMWHGIELGWAAALLAALTAYIRVLGASLGVPGLFLGPMAKQHRMALLTAGAVAIAASAWLWDARWVAWGCVVAIAVGALLTCWRRLAAIAAALRARV